MAKVMMFETPIGIFSKIELAEEKLAACDLDIHMVKCVLVD